MTVSEFSCFAFNGAGCALWAAQLSNLLSVDVGKSLTCGMHVHPLRFTSHSIGIIAPRIKSYTKPAKISGYFSAEFSGIVRGYVR